MKRNEIQPKTKEQGVALIVVMCMLVLIAVLVASTVSMSQSIKLASTTTTMMNKSVYLDESAAAKTLWLLQYDIINNSSRNIGKENNNQSEQFASTDERFMADGREHIIEVNGIKMSVTINDMKSGITITDRNSLSNLKYLAADIDTDTKIIQALNELQDKLTDYIDSDDYVNANGMESGGYTAEKLPNLPRNEGLFFREELLWIPGFRKFYGPDSNGSLSAINLIAPAGLKSPRGKPNIMSVSPEYIQLVCNFEDADLEVVKTALKDFKADPDLTLDDAFGSESDLLATLKQHFSFSESGYYTIQVRPAKNSGLPGRLLSITLRVTRYFPNTGLQYYNWQLY